MASLCNIVLLLSGMFLCMCFNIGFHSIAEDDAIPKSPPDVHLCSVRVNEQFLNCAGFERIIRILGEVEKLFRYFRFLAAGLKTTQYASFEQLSLQIEFNS